MTQKTAQLIFTVLNILAIFAVMYAALDFINITFAIKTSQNKIPFDSGNYYFLLMSVFWVMSFIQYAGLKKKQRIVKFANQILVIWFVFMIILANLIPYYLTNKLDEAGYTQCDDPDEISRTARGESSYYIKGGCL